jgi:hypothetical protein
LRLPMWPCLSAIGSILTAAAANILSQRSTTYHVCTMYVLWIRVGVVRRGGKSRRAGPGGTGSRLRLGRGPGLKGAGEAVSIIGNILEAASKDGLGFRSLKVICQLQWSCSLLLCECGVWRCPRFLCRVRTNTNNLSSCSPVWRAKRGMNDK